MGMTLDQLQEAIHTLYEGDTDTPTSSDDDYSVRTNLINAGINRWEHEDGMLWNELFVKLADASDGDKTTTADTTSYDCPTDFAFPGGYVRLYTTAGQSTYYSVIEPGKAQLLDNQDKNVCWFEGDPQNGYDLKFLDTHDASQTISYEYYKSADTLSSGSDVAEIKDPYFLVYYVVSRLYELDNRITLSQKAFQEGEQRMSQMRSRNMQPGWYQDSRLEDLDNESGIGGFGV